MRWRLEFYSERRGTLARYIVEAPTPAAAVPLGRRALLVDYPVSAPRRWPSLLEQARRVGGQDADGWVLHRIGAGE